MKLIWKGRTWEPGADFPTKRSSGQPRGRANATSGTKSASSANTGASPFRCLEMVAGSTSRTRGSGPGDRIIRGDALDVAQGLAAEGLAGKVQVAYVDPPYFSQADYHHEARLDGAADGRVRRTKAYGDRWSSSDDDGAAAYLDMLAPRLEALARLLAPTGSLWVQLDWRAAYLARVLLDEIFGRGGFKNEIVWKRAPNLGRQAASSQFGRTLDTLIVYGGPEARIVPPTRLEPIEESAIRWDAEGRPFTSAPRGDYTDASIAKLDAEGRVHRTASGKVYIKYFLVKDGSDRLCRERRVDTLWTDVAPLRHAQPGERTGYPTQKPLSLLERIVSCASEPGELVVDVFGGSGTTAEAAFKLGRRFVVSDAAPLAIATARARLLRAGASLRLESLASDEIVHDATISMDHANSVVPTPSLAQLTVHPSGDDELEVRLVSPPEPLAWAIGAKATAHGPFETIWHSERKPGTKTQAAALEARVSVTGLPLAARVFTDDGAVHEAEIPIPESHQRTQLHLPVTGVAPRPPRPHRNTRQAKPAKPAKSDS